MLFNRSVFYLIGTFVLQFSSLIDAQAFYGNVSIYSNNLGALDLPSSSMPAIVDAYTIILQTPPPSIPEIVDSATVNPQSPPLPTPAPGLAMSLGLPPPTAVPSPIPPDVLEMPLASADSTAPAPTPAPIGIDGNDVIDCPGCCSIYFQYVNVYYWPAASSNTDCLTLVSSQNQPPFPSGIPLISPSIYVVFPTISAGNVRTRVGGIYIDYVTSFAPGELSTIEGTGGSTKAFDFADLPCPPPAVAEANAFFYNPQVNPERAYSPRIDLPRGILDLDPAFKKCVAAIYQGFDPPIALKSRGDVTPARKNHFGLAQKRAPVHPHIKPRLFN